MTNNLFAIANVKQLRTYVVLEFYCFFFRNILVCWRSKFSIFLTVFTIWLSLARFFGGPSEFREVEHPNTPPGTPMPPPIPLSIPESNENDSKNLSSASHSKSEFLCRR
jgi:hypothetical protein